MLRFDLERGDDTIFSIPYIGMADDEAMERPDPFRALSAAILERS